MSMYIQKDLEHPANRRTALFFLRVWPGGQPHELRFRLEDIHTGQSIVFANVHDLVEYLENASTWSFFTSRQADQ